MNKTNYEQDTYRHRGLRRKLIASLRRKGIRDERVLTAMEAVPRHLFLDVAFTEWAYRDVPFPIGSDQTISQPYTVAFQTELLDVCPKYRVLEIGTGSGYQACVLALMGAKVYTVERVQQLYRRTLDVLESLGHHHIRVFHRDGNEGLNRFAPFDRILVTAGATDVPQTLLDQLDIGGKLVIPVGSSQTQKMVRIIKLADQQYERKVFGHFRFVPFLKGIEGES